MNSENCMPQQYLEDIVMCLVELAFFVGELGWIMIIIPVNDSAGDYRAG